MCVIVYKNSKVDFPSWRKLEKCFRQNPDGAGFMWIENNTVNIKKGFMEWQDFKKALKPFKDNAKYKNMNFAMHFRISTQGGVNAGATHPFPLSTSVKTLQAPENEASIAIMHNGIIPLTTSYTSKSNLSDTMLFVKDYLTVIAPSVASYKNPYIMDIIEEVINSKMLIFCNDGTIQKLGLGWKEVEGVQYSNLNWQEAPSNKSKKAVTKKNKITYTPAYYNGWEDDWYDEKTPEQKAYEEDVWQEACPFELAGGWEACNECGLDYCKYWKYESYI